MNIDSEFTIIGGGVAGLAAAIGFQNNSMDFSLFEQADQLKGIGAGFGLAANAMQALEYLGIREDIEKLGHHLDSYKILDDKGKVLVAPNTKTLSQQYNQRNFAIHRADLHLYLLSQVQPQSLHLGKKAIYLSQKDGTISIRFADGTMHYTKYLIIADGVKSPLRQQLIPTAVPRYAGYTCWRATIDNSTIALQHGSETWGQKGRFGMTPLTHNRIYWYACINATYQSETYRNYRIADLQHHFGHYHDPIPEILSHTQDTDLIWNDIVDIKPLQHLAYGNILLLGDAGHATTPNMGQGACQALEDVAVLMDELTDKASAPKAFLSFEKRRLQRTRYITKTSKRIGEVAQWENPFMISIRNTILKNIPAKMSQANLEKLLSVDFMSINT